MRDEWDMQEDLSKALTKLKKIGEELEPFEDSDATPSMALIYQIRRIING